LVEAVRGYAAHEKDTFEALTAARSKATSAQLSAKDLSDPAALQRLQDAQTTLSSALSRLLLTPGPEGQSGLSGFSEPI
jgi:LemA protein